MEVSMSALKCKAFYSCCPSLSMCIGSRVFHTQKKCSKPVHFVVPLKARIRGGIQVLCIGNGSSMQDNNSKPREISAEMPNFVSREPEPHEKKENSDDNFLLKLIIAMGIALAITFISAYSRRDNILGLRRIFMSSPSSGIEPAIPISGETATAFRFSVFGHEIVLPECTPGWVYFWLLMAAGCGLFISEEALNVWVGASLARLLSFEGSKEVLSSVFSARSSYIVSTILWVYWGVCISDMIPFYLGRFARNSKAADILYNKLGIQNEKKERISKTVQKYGNLIGFVERFSLGVRNPTSFLAGAAGVSPGCFFLGVCLGGLFTLSIQLGIGFLLRERPVAALGGVAMFVGIWSIFPYLAAIGASLIYILRKRSSSLGR